MAVLNTKNFATLVQNQAAAIQGRARQLIDFSVGSVLRAVIEANAGVALWLQGLAVKILTVTRASTSTAGDLDTFVEDYGLTRLGAQFAIGAATFSRFTPSAQALIPVGAIIKTLDGAQSYQVIADASNSAFNSGLNGYVVGAGIASLSVPVEALAPGPAGNAQAGFVGLISTSIPFVDTVSNAAAFAGGADQETDAALRARFINYILSLSRGTVAAIIYAVTSLRLGLQATVVENENYDRTPNEGFLCVTVATSDPNPVPDSVTLTKAAAAVLAYRAGGIWAGIFGPQVLTVQVQMVLVCDPAYDRNVLVGNAGEVIRGYINTLALGATLYNSKLVQLAQDSSPGVLSVASCRINEIFGGDLVADKRNIIRAGTVTIS